MPNSFAIGSRFFVSHKRDITTLGSVCIRTSNNINNNNTTANEKKGKKFGFDRVSEHMCRSVVHKSQKACGEVLRLTTRWITLHMLIIPRLSFKLSALFLAIYHKIFFQPCASFKTDLWPKFGSKNVEFLRE